MTSSDCRVLVEKHCSPRDKHCHVTNTVFRANRQKRQRDTGGVYPYLSTTRYPFACYKMLKELDDNGRHTRASNVRILLSRYGFGHVWLNQGVGDPVIFIKEFYQRICYCAIQEWNTQKSQYSKLALYNEVKTEFGYESYLSYINVKKCRAALCRLRCSCHGLMIEIGRYENIAKENRICQLCNRKGRQVIEDEYHFIVECETFTNLRNVNLKPECLNRNGFV